MKRTTHRSKWKMPEWMEPYRPYIVNTGGNTIEDLMNGDADPRVNLPLSALQACVKSQVALLEALDRDAVLPRLPRWASLPRSYKGIDL